LKIFYHTPPGRSAAFRLPKDLLKTLNEICAELDCNRSQLIRR
jgi:metal-responsive CopG/Arc/MetJ family transcriptional regulator